MRLTRKTILLFVMVAAMFVLCSSAAAMFDGFSYLEIGQDDISKINNCSEDQSCVNILYWSDESDLNVNSSNSTDYWDGYDTPSTWAGSHLTWTGSVFDVADDWYDSIGDLPTNLISDGDTSHIATNDQIYSFVVGQGYLTDANDTVNSTELDNLCNTDDRILRREGGTWVCHDDSVYYDDTNCSADQSCSNVLYTTDSYIGGLSCSDSEIAKYNSTSGQWECEPDDTGEGSTVTGSGTAGTIAKWTSSSEIGNSIITESGSVVTISGNLTADKLTGDLHCSNITGSTSNLCTLEDTTISNCSTDQSCTNVLYTTDEYLGGLSCSDTEIAKYNTTSGNWECASDEDTDTNYYADSVSFSGTDTKTITITRSGLSDITGSFDDIYYTNCSTDQSCDAIVYTSDEYIGGLSCSDGEIAKYNATAGGWECEVDEFEADTNNYTTGIGFSGTDTITLTLNRLGMSDLTDSFTDRYEADTTNPFQNLSSSRTGDTVTISITNGTDTSFIDNYEADTNASTACTGADTFLSGDGTCETDSDTTYSAGTLLSLATNTFDVNTGTLTDTKICTYESGVGLNCTHDDIDTTIGNCSADQSCTNVLYTSDEYVGGLSCADAEIAKYNATSGSWECESDDYEANTNTQLDDQAAEADVDMNNNDINNVRNITSGAYKLNNGHTWEENASNWSCVGDCSGWN